MGLKATAGFSPLGGLLRATTEESECIRVSCFTSFFGVPGEESASHASTRAAVEAGIPMCVNRSAKQSSAPTDSSVKCNIKKH